MAIRGSQEATRGVPGRALALGSLAWLGLRAGEANSPAQGKGEEGEGKDGEGSPSWSQAPRGLRTGLSERHRGPGPRDTEN